MLRTARQQREALPAQVRCTSDTCEASGTRSRLRQRSLPPPNAMDFSCERPPGALPVAQTAARDDLRSLSQASRAACTDAVSCTEAASRQLQILVSRLCALVRSGGALTSGQLRFQVQH